MSYGAEFNPNRLGLARRRRGLTKRKLAELIGADVRAVTAYESGGTSLKEKGSSLSLRNCTSQCSFLLARTYRR